MGVGGGGSALGSYGLGVNGRGFSSEWMCEDADSGTVCVAWIS